MATLLLGFAAVNTGNNLLFLVVAALLAFMSVTGVTGWLNIRGLKVILQVPDEVYCGMPTLVVVELVNNKRYFPSFLLNVAFEGENIIFPIIGRSARERLSLIYRFPERGLCRFTSITICSPFPVNFFVRCCTVTADQEYPVFPAPVPGPTTVVVSGRERRGYPLDGGMGHDGDIEKIGNYTGREPFKLIHWRLTAKYDEFKVKELGMTSQEPLMIEITGLSGATLEERLSGAVFNINRLMKSGHPVGLKLGQKLLPPAATRNHRLTMLMELALYGKG